MIVAFGGRFFGYKTWRLINCLYSFSYGRAESKMTD